MRDHPVTPMQEGDLRRHLGEQTDRPIGRVTVRDLETVANADTALSTASEDSEIIIFDAVDVDHLDTIGELLWERANEVADPLFTVGSSGLEHHALAHAWEADGRIDRGEQLYQKREPVEQLFVLSGSVSPMNAAQLDWAIEHGFEPIRLETAKLVDPDAADEAQSAAVGEGVDMLSAGKSVVCYSARGPDDSAIDETRQRFESLGTDGSLETRLGQRKGVILREVLERADLQRACVAGGDTSSHAIRELDIRALEAIAPVGPGGPLCRVHADQPAFEGLEIALKGGQVGTKNDDHDYFGVVRDGGVTE
jgi:uncharacterized protein YgbK (DUF1537 family)